MATINLGLTENWCFSECCILCFFEALSFKSVTENIKPPEAETIPTELKENFSQQFDLLRL